MKQLLAIDTTTEACSAAIIFNNDGEEQLLSRYQLAPRQHGELILAMVDELLSEAELSLEQLDALAVTIGPGAFTGVRLGVAVAQGLAFSSGLKLIPVNTLEVLAYAAAASLEFSDCSISVAMDARMSEVYWGCFQYKQQKLHSTSEQVVVPADRVPLPNDGINKHEVFAGTGWKTYSEQFEKLLNFSPDHSEKLELPTAKNALLLALQNFDGALSPELITPLYLRDKVAETIIERQAKKQKREN